MRCLLIAAATAVGLSASGALAADMAEGPPAYSPPDYGTPVACGAFDHKRYPDVVYVPPQNAYIVAQHCGVTKNWLGRGTHEDILVYYKGGSLWPDITMIRVPPWPGGKR